MKKRARMTATGKINVRRNAHKKLLRKKSARANTQAGQGVLLRGICCGSERLDVVAPELRIPPSSALYDRVVHLDDLVLQLDA